MDRLAAYYDAASGKKAEEEKKRADAVIKGIDEGQVLNQDILHKLDERKQTVLNMKEQKGLEVKKGNDKSELVKYRVYEEDEKIQFEKFHKNYKRDKVADDCIKKNVKDRNKYKSEKLAENAEKL